MITSRNMHFGFFTVALLSLAACSPSSPDAPRLAPSKIEKSFSVQQLQASSSESLNPLSVQDKGLISIQKSALGKAFLMSPVINVAQSNPILDHLQPVVVSFEKAGTQLGLFEVNVHAFYNELPVDKILQTFDIVSEDDKQITFSWKYGLQFLSQKEYYYYSDSEEEVNDLDKPDESVQPTVVSFVRDLSIHDNALFIQQVSRVRATQFTLSPSSLLTEKATDVTTLDQTVHINVRLTPYIPNKNFVAKESELKNGIGFFEQQAWDIKDKRKVIQAKRWDFSPDREPVVYAITKNTPAEYVQVAKEAIEYWNRVIGREVIRVETGADPREPARDRRVLVHWIDWLDAGFARAGMQSDPFTGELIGGNVYMTSVFVHGGSMSARAENRLKRPVRFVGLSGFKSSVLCERPLEFDPQSHELAGLTEVMAQQVAKDYVRSTIAHEVGHTLGMRHNFAGTYGSQLKDPAELIQTEKKYLAGELKEGAITSTTVMDYDATLESAMIGVRILTQALPYDYAAMDWAYIHPDFKVENMKVPLFCTDGHVGEKGINVGCQRFDSGRAPLLSKVVESKRTLDNMGARIGRLLITHLRPWREKAPSINEFYKKANAIDINERVGRYIRETKDLKTALQGTAEHIKTSIELGPKGWMNEDLWKTRTVEFMKSEWAQAGGLSQVLVNSLPWDTTAGLKRGWLVEQVQAFLQTEEARSGISLDGVSYELSWAEREALQDVLLKFAKMFEDKYVSATFKLFALDAKDKNQGFEPQFLDSSEEAKVGALVEALLLGSDKATSVTVGTQAISLALWRQPLAQRLQAVHLISPKNFLKDDWGSASRKKIKGILIDRLKQLGVEGTTATELAAALSKVTTLTEEIKKVLNEDVELLKALEATES